MNTSGMDLIEIVKYIVESNVNTTCFVIFNCNILKKIQFFFFIITHFEVKHP